MQSHLAFHLFALTQGVALLALLQLFVSSDASKTRWEMTVCIIALALISLSPMTMLYNEHNIGIAIALALSGFLTIGPALWLLVVRLTEISSAPTGKSHILHLTLPAVSFLISIWIMMLSTEQQVALFINDNLAPDSVHYLLPPILFILFIFWLVQSCWYMVAITRRLIRYRQQLRRYFSNTEQRDLSWIHWFGITLISTWLLLAISHFLLFSEHQFLTMEMGAVMTLCLAIVLALKGTQQRPGFDMVPETTQQLTDMLNADEIANNPDKYANSALDKITIQNFWQRIETWMDTDSGYLDPDLTMPELAKKVGISPSYVSQTLSEAFGGNFYEYINQRRIEFACTRLTQSSDTVLDIALQAGFNSRSSFYNAFKKEKGITPTQFRQQNPKG